MKLLLALCLLMVCSTCFTLTAQTTPVLKYQEGSVWVTGIGTTSIAEDQWKDIFRVYTQEAYKRKINQPIAGKYTRYGDSLSFTPDFSFASGQKYHAIFGRLELSFTIPKKKGTTFINDVYPQNNVLPENMLRMYISFSGPMMPGEAYDHIKLLTENGTTVEKAFLIIDQELWDTERTRFTLLFDPGRVKRNLQSNVDLGAPLQEGQTYRLVIDSTWRDANGNFLIGSYTKTFSVQEAERTKLSTQHWKITTPTAGTLDDLIIEFDRPVDHVLAQKCISIMATNGTVKGRAVLTSNGYWRFTPDQHWSEDQYHIEVHPLLEDVAGNNFNNVFDIDLSQESRINNTELIRHSFFIRSMVK